MGLSATKEERERRQHIKAIKLDHADMDNFFERYITGESFDKEKLKGCGYDSWAARNIAAYLKDPSDDTPFRRESCG